MRTDENGLTFIETLVALFLIALGVLAAAPMFIYATQGNAIGSDYGNVGAAALDRMELLRHEPFESVVLQPGGSITTSYTNGAGLEYFDDSDPDVIVRWQIQEHPTVALTRIIRVRAIASNPSVGAAKEVTLTTVRGR